MVSRLICDDCKKEVTEHVAWRCKCGGLLQAKHDFSGANITRDTFKPRGDIFSTSSGVWRYRELIYPDIDDRSIVSKFEGNTSLLSHPKISEFTGVKNTLLKHEGRNPTGSFKDRGMTVAVSNAKFTGVKGVACASTGNTSSSLAAYASFAGIRCLVFVPDSGISASKVAQGIAYGAKIVKVQGNFDIAFELLQKYGDKVTILNSINPWRLEGQKTIMFEIVQQLGWSPPDWIVVPAGNLGNTTSFGKAFRELFELGLIDKVPRIASIQAAGSAPFYDAWKNKRDSLVRVKDPQTIATAIKIGNPVNWKRGIEALEYTKGLSDKVTDDEILIAKSVIDKAGIGCEPASAASVAGLRKLRQGGVIGADESAVCILTGHVLKDLQPVIDIFDGKLSVDGHSGYGDVTLIKDGESEDEIGRKIVALLE